MKIQNIPNRYDKHIWEERQILGIKSAGGLCRSFDFRDIYGFVYPFHKSESNAKRHNDEYAEIHVYDEQKFLIFLLKF